MIEILKNSIGYKWLDVYILMNVIQLETLVFCCHFLDRKTDDPCGLALALLATVAYVLTSEEIAAEPDIESW